MKNISAVLERDSRLSQVSDNPQGCGRAPGWWSECFWTGLAGLFTAAIAGVLIALSPGEFWHGDFQSALMPGYVDMNRAILEGSYPLLSPYSWLGGCLGAEYQYGVFSLFHLGALCIVFKLGLPLFQTANALILIHLTVYGSGAFRLGRGSGLTRPNALIVAFAAALNGWMLDWGCQNWIPFLLSCCWLPWAWWAMLVARRRRFGAWRFVPAGVFLYLLLTAAFPQTDLMAAVVTVWIVLCTVLRPRRLRRLWRLARSGRKGFALRLLSGRTIVAKLWPVGAAWAVALALASPAILMLTEAFPTTSRCIKGTPASEHWSVPVGAVPGVILPAIVTEWSAYNAQGFRDCFEVYNGFVPAVALLAILLRTRLRFLRSCAAEFALLVGVGVLCQWGYGGPFRWPFRWLPLLHIVLGILGARAIQEWPRPQAHRDRRHWTDVISYLGCWGIVFLGIAMALAISRVMAVGKPGSPASYLSEDTADHVALTWICAALLGWICLVWIALDFAVRRSPGGRAWIPAVVMGLAIIGPWNLIYYPCNARQWPLGEWVLRAGQLDAGRLYFAFMSYADAYSDDAENGMLRRFGNTAMYAGVKFVSGYSPMPSYTMKRLFCVGGSGFSVFDKNGKLPLLEKEVGPDGLLWLLGVDGVVLSKDCGEYCQKLQNRGWKLVAKTQDDVVLHRAGPPLPAVRSATKIKGMKNVRRIIAKIQSRGEAPAPAILLAPGWPFGGQEFALPLVNISSIEESRLTVRCHVVNPSAEKKGLVFYSRAWYEGYRAFLDGKPLPVYALNGLQPAVLLPPAAHGELVLRFAPASVRYGLMIALGGAVLAAVVPWRCQRRRARKQPDDLATFPL